MLKLKAIAPALLLAAALVAAACGGDDDGDEETSTPAATPTPEATRKPDDATPTPTPPPAITEAPMELSEYLIKPSVTRARPGTVAFKVHNAGEQTHEFLVIRSDLPIAELPRLPGEAGVDEDQLDVTARLEAIASGADAEVSVDVTEGNYVLICNLVSGGESHYLEGMYQAFEVTLTAPDPRNTTPTPTATGG